MEEVDKGCVMTTIGVSGWMFLLVPAHLGCIKCEGLLKVTGSHVRWKSNNISETVLHIHCKTGH